MKKYFHQCVGCFAIIPTTKQGWDIFPRRESVCDDCFFEVAEIITIKPKKVMIAKLREYQRKHKV